MNHMVASLTGAAGQVVAMPMNEEWVRRVQGDSLPYRDLTEDLRGMATAGILTAVADDLSRCRCGTWCANAVSLPT